MADSHDPTNFDTHKDKKYRRQLFKHFCRRMHRKWMEHGKNIDESLGDNDDDNIDIENDAATGKNTLVVKLGSKKAKKYHW